MTTADELVDDLMSIAGAAMRPDKHLIQRRFRDALDRYVKDRYNPGHFLGAVLANNLLGALQHGDDAAVANLPHIVAYIYNELPGGCWGTPGRVGEWLAGGAE